MLAVACGMEDGDQPNNIDSQYDFYKKRCDLEDMVAMSEFEYINRVVIRNSISLKAK